MPHPRWPVLLPGRARAEFRRMARPRWKRLSIRALKSLIAIVVLWAVGRHVFRTWSDLRASGVSVHFRPEWLVGSGLLYLAGLLACGRFYERILRASPTPVKLIPALRSYLISHVAKYVPGKAMVVVVRTGMVVPFGARASTAAIATFYETLVMMAAGGLIAALGFLLAGSSHPIEVRLPGWGLHRLQVYQLCALAGGGFAAGFLFLVLPRVFGRLARLVTFPVPGVGPDALPSLSGALLAQGLLWSSAAWILLGLSMAAVVRAVDQSGAFSPLGLRVMSALIAGVALATVAGFVVAVLPGGLGVREGVLMWGLAPALGQDESVVAALVLRLVWVAAELLAAACLLPLFRRQAPARTVEGEPSVPTGRSAP
jgi:glycosyltransferase 2 family protein